MREKIISYVTVARVEERKRRVHVGGFGKDARFADKSDGWYVVFNEWPSAAYVGPEKPSMSAGDKIKITMEVVP